ncbi:hypothetical protein AQUCO_00500076v1 [Aquilegia coerulea]|uniref:Transmembrane protein n=1 Tax=Aquilegia coerulea TaxID=218851 RepID=A0A2G5EQA7_AQUCA|nr:hypothetical protein AQUCO_00500076v1 [Aquilegia coerulea]
MRSQWNWWVGKGFVPSFNSIKGMKIKLSHQPIPKAPHRSYSFHHHHHFTICFVCGGNLILFFFFLLSCTT